MPFSYAVSVRLFHEPFSYAFCIRLFHTPFHTTFYTSLFTPLSYAFCVYTRDLLCIQYTQEISCACTVQGLGPAQLPLWVPGPWVPWPRACTRVLCMHKRSLVYTQLFLFCILNLSPFSYCIVFLFFLLLSLSISLILYFNYFSVYSIFRILVPNLFRPII